MPRLRRLKRLPGESDLDYIDRQLDPVHWATLKALQVFTEIRAGIGDAAARRVFKMWSEPPSATKLKWIEERGIRDEVELFGRSKGEIARERARQKHGNPTPEQIEAEKRQLRRKLNKPRPRPKARRGRTKAF